MVDVVVWVYKRMEGLIRRVLRSYSTSTTTERATNVYQTGSQDTATI